MTRREYLECRLARRQEWAEKATKRSERAFDKAGAIAVGIPLGQPILVGHHSEAHARRDAERIDNAMHRGCEEHALAEHHSAMASGLERALDHSIFFDDDNAIAALEARIAERETERARCKEINAAIRKGTGWSERITPPLTEIEKRDLARNAQVWGTVGYPAYVLTNLGASIRRDRERIEEIKRRTTRSEQAYTAGGVLIEGGEYVRITFADKPDRSTIDALEAADYCWHGGSWYGRRDQLPAGIEAQS